MTTATTAPYTAPLDESKASVVDEAKFIFPVRTLENDRIKLTPFNLRENHHALFFRAQRNYPEVYRWLPWGPFTTLEEMLNDWYYPVIHTDPTAVMYLILDKTKEYASQAEGIEEKSVAGVVAFLNASAQHSKVEIGSIVIFTPFQRSHVTTNVVGLMLHYALDLPKASPAAAPFYIGAIPQIGGLGLRRCQWQADSHNQASCNAALRMGMTKEGILRWDRVIPADKSKLRPISVTNQARHPLDNGEHHLGRHTFIASICWEEWLETDENHKSIRDKVDARMVLCSLVPLIVQSSLNQIHANLAIEQLLIKKATKRRPILFLWRNSDSLILGRNQNAFSELDLNAARKANVDVARRFTGGGAVYQDMGNTVFTFIHFKSKIDKRFGNQVILNALKTHGIRAEASGRNDLLLNGKKFSGSAFQQKSNIFVHHGTLIRHMDVDRLSQFLTPHSFKLSNHPSTPSVRSRVIQLNEYKPSLTHEHLVDALSRSFKEALGAKEAENLHIDHFSEYMEDPVFLQMHELLCSKDWIYGSDNAATESVWFTNEHGVFEVLLTLKDGLISSLRVYSDALDIELPRRVERVLKNRFMGRKFRHEDLEGWVKRWDPYHGQVAIA